MFLYFLKNIDGFEKKKFCEECSTPPTEWFKRIWILKYSVTGFQKYQNQSKHLSIGLVLGCSAPKHG